MKIDCLEPLKDPVALGRLIRHDLMEPGRNGRDARVDLLISRSSRSRRGRRRGCPTSNAAADAREVNGERRTRALEELARWSMAGLVDQHVRVDPGVRKVGRWRDDKEPGACASLCDTGARSPHQRQTLADRRHQVRPDPGHGESAAHEQRQCKGHGRQDAWDEESDRHAEREGEQHIADRHDPPQVEHRWVEPI